MWMYKYCGKHVILDMQFHADSKDFLRDTERLKLSFEAAAKFSDATIIGSNWHHFGEDYGVTGTLILAESHMSVHTWPEYDYVAADIFMCGKCDPKRAADYLLTSMPVKEHMIKEEIRGVVNSQETGVLMNDMAQEWIKNNDASTI